MPNFMHTKMITNPFFISIFSIYINRVFALHPPPEAILIKDVHKRQTFLVILFMGKIMVL